MGIATAGRAVISARLYGTSLAAYGAIGMGTGITGFTTADTTLGTEVTASGGAASGVHVVPTASVTATSVTTTLTNDTAQFVGTVAITGTIAVTESGLFNADTNGTLLARQTFSAVNVVSGDSIQFTWKIKNA
jgi:hypothetical protein